MVTPAEALKSVNHTVVDDAVDDDWTIVVRRRNNHNRKFPKLKSPKQQEAQIQEQTQWTPTDVETTAERELKLMQRIQNTIEKLESSYFFYIFLKQISSPEVLECFRKLRGSEEKIKMVIYGIGSIEAYEGPRLQLSLAILMKRKLDWIGEMEVFDPVISLTESKLGKVLISTEIWSKCALGQFVSIDKFFHSRKCSIGVVSSLAIYVLFPLTALGKPSVYEQLSRLNVIFSRDRCWFILVYQHDSNLLVTSALTVT
nr:hypothetical protein [Tanacetum cinerariifolium]